MSNENEANQKSYAVIMMETLKKLQYKIDAGVESAVIEKQERLENVVCLTLCGINKEKVVITGMNRQKHLYKLISTM